MLEDEILRCAQIDKVGQGSTRAPCIYAGAQVRKLSYSLIVGYIGDYYPVVEIAGKRDYAG